MCQSAGRRLLGTALIAFVLGSEASAHEIWINKDRRTNAPASGAVTL